MPGRRQDAGGPARPRAQPQVMADPTQVDQVLINLAANARDAMGTGGRLTHRDRRGGRWTSLWPRARGQHARARAVRAPHRVRHRLRHGPRRPWRRSSSRFSPPSRWAPAPGSGLSTVYGIVKQHDGFIWAYSEPGLGTTDEVYLPRRGGGQPRRGARDGARGGAAAALEPALVLVVEDESAVRNLVRRSLEAVGLDGARGGERAGRRSRSLPRWQERPSLVLTDVIMPGLNGRELSEALALTPARRARALHVRLHRR